MNSKPSLISWFRLVSDWIGVLNAHSFMIYCDWCQRNGNITKRQYMAHYFGSWTLWCMRNRFYGTFHTFKSKSAHPCCSNIPHQWCQSGDQIYNFTRFGTPRAIISDEGSHFYNKVVETLLAKYMMKHKTATIYHPQTSGQAKISKEFWRR